MKPRPGRNRRFIRPIGLIIVGVLVTTYATSGCARHIYRRHADREVYRILSEKTRDPQWAVPRLSIEPQADSRLFDPTHPDRPPMPPDDPAAHELMHCADHKHGYLHWHRDGDLPSIEWPGWAKYLELDEQDQLRLDSGRAVQLGLLHSREYQFELENLYVTALALSLERFEFDVQWFGRNFTFYEYLGKQISGRPDRESNRLETRSNLGFTRNFAAGGQLLVDFANTYVWEWTGTNSHFTFSNIAVRLVQPLLRGAARDVRMEGLTQVERDVLYAARDFARFRRTFYFDIVAGEEGYLPLLLQVQAIRNQEANLVSLEQNLRAHEALAEAGIVSGVQVDQVFQSYQAGRLNLIQARNNYQTSLDRYKIRLGLPPEVPADLDESLLEPFELTSPELAELQQGFDVLLSEFRRLDEAPPREALRDGLERLRALHARLQPAIRQVQAELQRWRVPGEIADDAELGELLDPERLREARATLVERLDEVAEDYASLGDEVQRALAMVPEAAPEAGWQSIQRLARSAENLVQDVSVLQTQIRVYLIELPPVGFDDGEETVRLALSSRLDLMNQRAAVVDAWRKIRVAADGLESDLDVVAEADIATLPDSKNPVRFTNNASRYRVGVRLDGPLNRRVERNIYRAELINYQRARRDFMARRDAVVRDVRLDLRQLRADRLAFEISRQSLVTAARQVEEARLQLLEPGQTGDSSRTQDVLNALNSLLVAKNALIGIWVRYETGRLQLQLDLEQLRLDERGLTREGDQDVEKPTGHASNSQVADGNATDGNATDGNAPRALLPEELPPPAPLPAP